MEVHKLISDILEGTVRVLPFDNVAFGPDTDITAGVLSALNFARVAFAVEGTSPLLSQILTLLCSRKTVDRALAISHDWPSDLHLQVEDVYHIPLFEASLKLVSTDYDSPTPDHIERLLENLRVLGSSAAILITRYPDVVTCVRLRVSREDVFILFNPRGTSEDDQVATLTIATSLTQIAQRLCDVFPLDETRANLGRQAELVGKCTGHVFSPRASSHDARAGEDCLIVSSLTLLTLRAELEELTRDNDGLKKDNERLEKSIVDLDGQLQEEKTKVGRAQSSKQSTMKSTRAPSPGPSRGRRAPPQTQPSRSTKEREYFFEDDPNLQHARQLQATFDSENESLLMQQCELIRGRRAPPLTQPSRSTKEREYFFEDDPNLQYARQLQAMFDSENESLLMQQRDLIRTAQRQYHCGVCLDDFPEDDVVHIDACGHEICRDCARGHVCSKIDEHRFPVLCPVCMADHKNQNPGTISGVLVQLLGVSEEQWATWVEMEIAQFSILVNCRKCNQSGFVDRRDLEAESEIHCPFMCCGHVWCKLCQQTIEPGGSKHSCDGTAELDHLMKEQGWRYCPNCRTPIQKTEGCNHLSCVAPGCNTHFCYRCGEMINRTAVPQEIQAGKMEHHRKCSLW